LVVIILSIAAFLFFAKIILDYFKTKFKQNQKVNGLLAKSIIVALVEIILLYIIAKSFAITTVLIFIPWIIGAVIIIIYFILKSLTIGNFSDNEEISKPETE
ncbi:hypothetical protein DRQ33_02695, partial [bacterium]